MHWFEFLANAMASRMETQSGNFQAFISLSPKERKGRQPQGLRRSTNKFRP